MIVVAVARAADVPLAVDGEEIPILAFAELTLGGSWPSASASPSCSAAGPATRVARSR